MPELYRRLRRKAGRARARLAGRPAAPAPRPGRAPEVGHETTHLGPAMVQAVFRAKRRMRIGADPDYDLVYENFDVVHYALQAPGVLDRPRLDLVDQFLRMGVEYERSPDPDFSMTRYLARYPHLADGPEASPYLHWLKRGRAAGEIADPAPGIPEMAHVLGLEPQQVVDLVVERRTDLQKRFRTGRLGEMFARAAEIEPLIGAAWTELARPRLLPFSSTLVTDQLAVLYGAQEAAGFRRARLVLVINRARWGGGRRMEGHLTHALASHVDPEDVVVIYTDDTGDSPPGRFPEGVREVDFARLVQDLPEGPDMPEDQAQAALVALLRSFRAEAIVNINSRMLYGAMRTYGRALAGSERLFLCFFCNEQTAMGNWAGYSLRYFYRLFESVAGVITDSDHLAGELAKSYRIGGKYLERIHVFRAPVDPHLPVVPPPPADPDRRPQVFWAGRWDRQKRIGLFLQVARELPDVDFRMWGEPVLGGGGPARNVPPNVTVQGRYAHISQIPLDEADLWLYTSGWDGVPSQLLEVAMTGIPIVGTLVGGTGEVMSEADAWPVAEHGEARDYVQAIREVLADPAGARRRAHALRERMLRERTEGAFAAKAADVLLPPQPQGDTDGQH